MTFPALVYGSLETLARRNLTYLVVVLIILYSSLTIYSYCFTYSYMPDEFWFYQTALNSYRDKSVIDIIIHKNDFGYGGIWFTLYCGIIYLVDSFITLDIATLISADKTAVMSTVSDTTQLIPMMGMRLVSLFAILSVLLRLLNYTKQNKYALAAVILFLLTPALYWSGKVASPDILVACLGLHGVFSYFFAKQQQTAFVFLGIGLSVKLSILPLVLVVLLVAFCTSVATDRIRPLLAKLLILLSITLLLSPYFLYEYKDYMLTLEKYLSHGSIQIPLEIIVIKIKERLFGEGRLWDLGYSGSLAYLGFSIWVVVCFYVVMIRRVVQPFYVFFLIFFVITAIALIKRPNYGWNWLPLIFICPLLVLPLHSGNKFSSRAGLTVLLIGFLFNLSDIVQELRNRLWQHENLHAFLQTDSEVRKCVDDIVAHTKGYKKLNFAEIGLGIEDAPSFLASFFTHKRTIEPNMVVFIGNRTDKILPNLAPLPEKFSFDVKKCGFISVYIVHR